MKKKSAHILLAILALLLSSCSVAEGPDHLSVDGEKQYTAIVTVKKSPADTVYFQLNDSIKVYPVNYQEFDRMQRVICNVTVANKHTGSFPYTCQVQWLEALEEGFVSSDSSIAGSDGLTIMDDWITCVEDGYMTLHYFTYWGRDAKRHGFNLITGSNPADPYEVVLKHNANGDAKDELGDSIICFDINSLPDTGGAYKTLTLKWTNSGGATSTKEFRFKTRE